MVSFKSYEGGPKRLLCITALASAKVAIPPPKRRQKRSYTFYGCLAENPDFRRL